MPQKATDAHRNIADLAPGDRLDDAVYLITQKDLRTTSNGSLYIHVVLADRTGQVLARMWNASKEIYDSLPDRGLIAIRARVESYKGKPQVILDGVRTAEEGEGDPAAFLPHTQHDVGRMWERTKEILRSIKNPDLLALLGTFLNDETLVDRFRRSPAARANHHAFVGGLLEHTLNLLELAALIAPRYPRVDRDLVLAGVFLHDIGKTAELTCDASFDYTTEGQLLGHIVQGVLWVRERATALSAQRSEPFPIDLLNRLEHILVAHHGKYEFGSPRLPATPEAVLVHYIDNLDAKLEMMFEAVDADPNPDSDWTGWVPALEARVLKPAAERPH